MQKSKEISLTKLTTEFEVRDALGGYLTGMWETDKNRLKNKGYECDESVYDEAYSISENP